MIVGIVKKEGVAFERLIVELYENRIVKDVQRYRVVLDRLKEYGLHFSLDNFGGNNAGMEYIKTLPIDMVQFDRQFTISYNHPKMSALLEGYVEAMKKIEIETLVKWVDNEELLEKYRRLGIDYAQGFLISDRPLSGEKLIEKYGVKDAVR